MQEEHAGLLYSFLRVTTLLPSTPSVHKLCLWFLTPIEYQISCRLPSYEDHELGEQ